MTPDELSFDELTPGKPTLDETTPDELTLDETTPDELTLDETTPDTGVATPIRRHDGRPERNTDDSQRERIR